jgi:O-antigen ligase
LGVLATAIGSSQSEDVAWMAKKTMLLVMAVPFLLAFEKPKNRQAGLIGIFLGFWIAFILSGNMHNWSWHGERYEGATWDVGMWGVLCAMLMTLLVPLFFHKQFDWKWRALIFTTFFAALYMLITTGSRGPMLGAASGILTYLFFRQHKALIAIAVSCVVIFYGATNLFSEQTVAFENRVLSVANTKTDTSNNIRLALWETGFHFIKKQFNESQMNFWLGNGQDGKSNLTNDFYYNEFKDLATVKPGLLAEMKWKINDMHNMYIESAIQNGILWTVVCFLMLIWFSATQSLTATAQLICFFAIGLTYAILPHFALMVLIFFISFLRGFEKQPHSI